MCMIHRYDSVWKIGVQYKYLYARESMMRIMPCLLLIIISCPLALSADYIWIEGEAPDSFIGKKSDGFDVKKNEERALLSGGEWLNLSVQEEDEPIKITYDIDVPVDGRYKVLVRKFWKHGRFRWRLGGSPWQTYERDGPLLDSVDIRKGLVVNWIPLGTLELKPGLQALEIESTGKGPLCLDCFIITRHPFVARGKFKPDESMADPEPGKWVFDPQPDDFARDALLDLRYLNEKVAGEKGFVQLDQSGNGFADGQGRPLRFWCTSSGYALQTGHIDDAERHARFLAKRGVNLVQILGGYIGNGCYRTPEGEIHEINRDYQEHIWRAVAANKKAGVYTTFSCLGALGYGTYLPESWKLSPDGSRWRTTGSWFWDPRLRKAYKAWLKTFFTEVNPHTGISLAQDKSIAYIQLMAEDGMLFFTSTKIEGAQRRMFEGIFGDWLKKKYGSLDKAVVSWDGSKHKDDAHNTGRMGLYDMWQFMGKPEDRGPEAKRLADQLEFFSETQRSFYDEMHLYCREELGMKQLTMSGVWRTANDERMLDMERWTYAGVDVAGKSHFFDSPHQNAPGSKGNTTGYQINAGDLVQPRSAMEYPGRLPFMQKRNVGQPFMNHQCCWNPSSPLLSESVLIMGAWGALSGLDVTGWFGHGASGFATSLRRWAVDIPDVFGGFPAAAVAFRRGDVREGRPAVIDRRSFAQMRNRKLPLIAEATGFDPNRDETDTSATEFDSLVYLTGPVQVEFMETAHKDYVDPNLDNLIDREKGIVKSNTGELTLFYKKGYAVVDTERFKGLSGFLKKAGGDFDLGAVRVLSEDDYATVMIVSLDGNPLETSESILAQVTTTARPTGWKTEETRFIYDKKKPAEEIDGYRIVSTGTPPFQIAESHVTLTLQNLKIASAFKLDANGKATGRVDLEQKDGKTQFVFPRDAMYVMLNSGR